MSRAIFNLLMASFGLAAIYLNGEPAIALPPVDNLSTDPDTAQMTSVSQLSDVQPTDWAFQALQSLVERYGCVAGYPNATYQGNRSLTRFELAAALNACLNQINEKLSTKDDLAVLQRLISEFTAELGTLRGRVDILEANNAEIAINQFSPTTKLYMQVITAITDTFGNSVGGNSDRTNTEFAQRIRFNVETSFTGKDLLRTRLEVADFPPVRELTRTNMTLLNFGGNTQNRVVLPHLLYRFPIGSSISITVGPLGVGYTDITDTLTPATISDDSLGIPSNFGEYSPLYRRGGGGAAVSWNILKDLTLTLGYLAGNPALPTSGNGLFGGSYNALAQLAYRNRTGGIGIAYSRSYAPQGQVDLTGSTGSFLATRPFGDNIATSSDLFSLQGFYQFTPNFQVHGWIVYTNATAEDSGLSSVADGRGGSVLRPVFSGDKADIWYGAIGLSFPDVGGKGNLPGILVGLPPRVTRSDVRSEPDTSYHIEAFYRLQINGYFAITPAAWVVINPENDRANDTQVVGVVRASFNF